MPSDIPEGLREKARRLAIYIDALPALSWDYSLPEHALFEARAMGRVDHIAQALYDERKRCARKAAERAYAALVNMTEGIPLEESGYLELFNAAE